MPVCLWFGWKSTVEEEERTKTQAMQGRRFGKGRHHLPMHNISPLVLSGKTETMVMSFGKFLCLVVLNRYRGKGVSRV